MQSYIMIVWSRLFKSNSVILSKYIMIVWSILTLFMRVWACSWLNDVLGFLCLLQLMEQYLLNFFVFLFIIGVLALDRAEGLSLWKEDGDVLAEATQLLCDLQCFLFSIVYQFILFLGINPPFNVKDQKPFHAPNVCPRRFMELYMDTGLVLACLFCTNVLRQCWD
jgi:hypothetical protein